MDIWLWNPVGTPLLLHLSLPPKTASWLAPLSQTHGVGVAVVAGGIACLGWSGGSWVVTWVVMEVQWKIWKMSPKRRGSAPFGRSGFVVPVTGVRGVISAWGPPEIGEADVPEGSVPILCYDVDLISGSRCSSCVACRYPSSGEEDLAWTSVSFARSQFG